MLITDVAIGSKITIKHLNTQGGFLHSHGHNYPSGSKRMFSYFISILVV